MKKFPVTKLMENYDYQACATFSVLIGLIALFFDIQSSYFSHLGIPYLGCLLMYSRLEKSHLYLDLFIMKLMVIFNVLMRKFDCLVYIYVFYRYGHYVEFHFVYRLHVVSVQQSPLRVEFIIFASFVSFYAFDLLFSKPMFQPFLRHPKRKVIDRKNKECRLLIILKFCLLQIIFMLRMQK